MKLKIIIMSIISVLCTILSIIAIFTTNLMFYIVAIILTTINLPLVYKYRNELDDFFTRRNGQKIEDERTKLLDAKSSNVAYGVTVAIIINVIVIILTLRNIYPFLIPTAIILIAITIISFISYVIAKYYYS